MRYWVFTTKPGHFDMMKALVPGETLDWPTFSRFKFEQGDLVFFYASSPVLQMIGKTEIERTDLPFSEVDPRNDLRKWPRHHSTIPWLRLRVLQTAPVPFKPLQRGSLYYHTEFKPSPYPKLLHEGEIEYVLRAFDEAMTFRADAARYPGGVNPAALDRCRGGEILARVLDEIPGSKVSHLDFDDANDGMTLILTLPSASLLMLKLAGLRRVNWDYEKTNSTVTGLRLDMADTFMHLHIDGADIEILAEILEIK